MKSKAELADFVLSRHADLLSDRSTWDNLWQDIADYCLPRKAEITTKREFPTSNRNDLLFDSTALYANATLANGQLSYLTPADSRWFVFEPPEEMKNDKAKQWFQRCSEITQRTLANSNFYSEVHELYFDDSTFGTYALYCEPGKTNVINFQSFTCGTFAIAENDEGLVDTLYREMQMTCLQAVDKFGLENLSPRLQKAYNVFRETGKGSSVKHDFVHAIYPRPEKDREAGKEDGANKSIASVYVEKQSKHVCRVSGYDEQPFFSGRHLKWGTGPYGWSPAWIALPEARQLNFLAKQLDSLAEVKAFPRLLIPATHEGEVDLRAAGTTYFDPQMPQAIPREWATAGEYAIGLERERRKEENINKAFHVDLFRMFAGIDKQMTAREVAERSSEKLVQFSPTFARKTTELFNPLLRRVFSILLRAGKFPEPIAEVVQPNPVTGEPEIPEPEILYTSRVALAIKSLQNLAFMRTMEQLGPLVQVKPEMLDNFNTDVIARDIHRNDGSPADWLTDEDARDQMREQRAQQQAEMMEQQQAMMQAETAAKAGSIKKDSVLADQIKQAL